MDNRNGAKEYDLKYLLLEKLNFVEELTLKEACCYDFNKNDIITASRILTMIQNGSFTPATLGKKLNISRQAIHKSISALCTKGFLELHDHETNKKTKVIHITKQGEELLECRTAVMEKVEKQIADTIGEKKLKDLKELLTKQW